MTSPESTPLTPWDEHNQKLIANVQPPDWQNPVPEGNYNLVVIGAGAAGLISAAIGAGLGAKVALIERKLLGGDCLNVGCVPSKALIRAARAAADVRNAGEFGVRVPDGVEIDFPAIMERMRRLRAKISPVDSAERYREMGVDVFLGQARFLDSNRVEVGGQQLLYSKAVIATGARAIELPIPGLSEAGCLTNETIFSLTELPRRLAVIGAGPIGCELAQSFQRFGSEVTLVEQICQILPREDREAAQTVEHQFERDGIKTLCEAKIERIEKRGEERVLHLERHGEKVELIVDQILIGVGRAPNVEGLGLDDVSVKYDARKGVEVDDYLRTSNSSIYACGDICLPQKFTHTADASAQIVVQNALFGILNLVQGGRKKFSDLIIPWCTYTDPEIAHVGLYEKEAQDKGIEVETYSHSFADVDRAILEGEEDGFVKIHVRKGTDKILGATIVARHAGEMISEITAVMNTGKGLGALGSTIHPYPTQAEAIKRVAGAYTRTRLTPGLKKFFARWMAWTR